MCRLHHEKCWSELPFPFPYMQSTSYEMPGWMNHKLVKIAGRNINNLRYADDTTLMAESEEELKD